jgi:hypothetical protein
VAPFRTKPSRLCCDAEVFANQPLQARRAKVIDGCQVDEILAVCAANLRDKDAAANRPQENTERQTRLDNWESAILAVVFHGLRTEVGEQVSR